MNRSLFQPLVRNAVTAGGLLSLAFVSTSCQPNAGSGAAVGAAVGAGIGALAGDGGGSVLKGAAIGAGVGAVTGAVIKAKRYKGSGGDPSSDNYPTATRTSNSNIVKSPYSPYNAVDVTGFRSGELAIDPTTNKVFRVP